MDDPENIHLVVDKPRLGPGHQQIEQRALAVRLKFVTVRVIKEFHTVFGERFTGAVEDGDGLAAGFLIEVTAMLNPRAAGILQPERLGIARNSLDVVAVTLVGEVAADRFEVIGVEQCLEFFGREIVCAGELDVFDPEAADFWERAGHVLRKVRAQTVELKPEGAVETRSNAGPGGGRWHRFRNPRWMVRSWGHARAGGGGRIPLNRGGRLARLPGRRGARASRRRWENRCAESSGSGSNPSWGRASFGWRKRRRGRRRRARATP